MRRYWWVNQNKTFEQERAGGYLWSPKVKRDGSRNPYYDFMRVVQPNDIVLSFVKQHVTAISIVERNCYESPKPREFGAAGDDWNDIGWRVDVVYRDLEIPFKPARYMDAIRPLLPPRYAPLRANGHGLQNLYLTELSPSLMSQFALLIGEPLLQWLDAPPAIIRDPVREENPVQERWERRLVAEIEQLTRIPETERRQLIDARVGQGRFRSLVYEHERSCRVTRVDRPEHLIASHIRPWRHSDNEQRLDPENGLMLTPNVDHLFDRGFITFTATGRLVYSPAVHRESVLRMGFDPDATISVGEFSSGQKEHLEFHRAQIFLGPRTAA